MNKKLITVVLLVIGGVGGCAALGTRAVDAYARLEEIVRPALDAMVYASPPVVIGQIAF